MDSPELPAISCMLAPCLETPAHIELAERLGYRTAWCYDSPALYADPWMMLALAAGRTRDIGLGPATLVPSLRHPMVTAAALTTLAGLAPGRVSAAFGTGLTGRMLLGQRPMRWDDVRQYVRTVRALLRGEDAIWNEKPVRMAQPAGFAAARPADVSVLIAADGQKGRAVAAELGDGVLSARVPDVLADAAGAGTGQHRMVVLTFGTVLGDDEEATSPRAIAAAGPALAAAYHAIYESRGPAGVDRLPGGLEWRDAIEAVDQEHRHLAIHEGHLAVLSGHDETLVAMAASLLPKWTVTGTAVEVRARLAKLPAAGVSEIAYQPMGPDIARELTAFAEAAGLRVTERQVAQPKTTATGGGLE